MTIETIVIATITALAALRFAPRLFAALLPYAFALLDPMLAFAAWVMGRPGRIIRLGLLSAVVLPIFGLNLYLFAVTSDLPDLEPLIHYRPKQIGVFYDGKGVRVIEIATQYREPVSYEELPAIVRHAIIAAEDKRYYTRLHAGIDLIAMPRVFYKNLMGYKPQGGSTITQQVTRGVLMKDEMALERTDTLVSDSVLTRALAEWKGVPRTNRIVRKVREIKYAPYVERALTDHFEAEEVAHGFWDRLLDGRRNRARIKAKEHDLGVYASEVYLGNGRYGFKAASRYYFCKNIREIKPHEAALLASFIPFPGIYASRAGGARSLIEMRERRNEVLLRMYRSGFLDRGEMVQAMLEPVALCDQDGGSKTLAPAAVNVALKEAKELGIEHQRIVSGFAHPIMTIDLDIQEAVNRGIQAGKENFVSRWPDADIPQMAVVVLRNRDAAILGIYGGHVEDEVNNYSSYNRATMAVRQPGSTFKGIDVLAAVIHGVTPRDMFEDRPYCINLGGGRGRHCVSNYDGTYKGWMNVREIISQSRNVPTLRMVDSLKDESRKGHKGIDEVIAVARTLGLTTELDRYSVTALGSKGVIPLEFANAYRAIASGVSAAPYIVHQVADERGNILVERKVSTEPLPVSPMHLRTVQELLRGTIRLPHGTGRALANFHVPCAGKTGTSNDHRDAWFVCFTYGMDGVTVLAWVGYDEFLRPLPHEGYPKATGASAALPIVRAILDGMYGENKPLGEPPQFPEALERNIDEYMYWYYTFPTTIQ